MTTIFVGNYYEVNATTGEITKYYYAGTQRIATLAPHCVRCSAGVRKQTVPENPQVTYLLGDHLGSTSIVTDDAGTLVVETRYKPWGEVRYSTPDTTLPTRYSYTGQYSHMSDDATDLGNVGFGLMFYNARWYDPSLSRFVQADSIVPDGVQGYDRYAYANNNPLYYTDPDGHFAIPAAVVVGAMVLLKVVDYGWTAYDIVNAGSVYLDGNATQAMRDDATETIAMAIAFEAMEPDEASPVALPLDDIVRHGDDVVDLYRAVSKSELDDIFSNRIFRPKPGGGSFDVKEFWLTMKGARGFAEHFNLPEIVKVTVPKRTLEYASEIWSNLDQLGPAAGWVDDGLDVFNDAIISITHVWSK